MARAGIVALVFLVSAVASRRAEAPQPAPTPRPERLPFEAFTSADGLAQDTVYRIVSDADGFLWFATAGGLSQFDGERFTTFGEPDGLRGRVVHDIAVGGDGTDWVATEAGLFRFRPGEPSPPGGLFRETTLEGLAPRDGPYRLLVARDGAVWVGTFAGLWRVEADPSGEGYRSREVGLVPGGNRLASRVQSLAEDPGGAIWVGTHTEGIFRVSPDGRVDHLPDRADGASFVRAFHFEGDGRVWSAFFGGVAVFDRPPFGDPTVRATILGPREGVAIDTSSLLASGDGTVLVGTSVGLSTVHRDPDGTFRTDSTLDRRSGLPGDTVSSMTLDVGGNLWLGLVNRGAVKCIDNGLSTVADAGDAGALIVDLADDAHGRVAVLAATGARTLTVRQVVDGRASASRVSLPPDLTYVGWGATQKFLRDRDGSWWIATGAGVLRFDDPGSIGIARLESPPDAVYRPAQGLPSIDAFVLMEHSNGDVWISAAVGTPGPSSVSRWSRSTGRIENFTAARMGTGSLASRFLEDRGGDVWIAFIDGTLVRHRDGRFEMIVPVHELETGFPDLLPDHRGRLWVTGRQTVLVFDDPTAPQPRFERRTIAAARGAALQCAVEDRSGRIWFGTDRGVLRFDPVTGESRLFTVEDGLAGNSITQCHGDASGALWFSDGIGLSRVEPRPDPPVALPRARLRAVLVAGEPVPLPAQGATVAGQLELASDRRRVAVEFFAVHHGPGPRPRFQFRLEGLDRDWSAPTDVDTVRYASLAPGRYRFLVRTVAEDGTASDAPAVVTLHVPAPLWRRGWFLVMIAAAVAAIATAAYRLRVRRLVQLEQVRTRIATDLHDDIGSSLSRIAILSEVVRREVEPIDPRSGGLLSQIAGSARDLTDALADIVWSLDPRRDDLGHTVFRLREYAADVLPPSGIAWRLESPQAPERIRLSAERRRHLYLILKEAIHNVVKHAGASSVSIALSIHEGELRAEVRDDGRGIVPEGIRASGNGLGNMRSRAAQAGGRLEIDSAAGRGTRVFLTLPLA